VIQKLLETHNRGTDEMKTSIRSKIGGTNWSYDRREFGF